MQFMQKNAICSRKDFFPLHAPFSRCVYGTKPVRPAITSSFPAPAQCAMKQIERGLHRVVKKKLLITMKLTAFIMLIFCMHVAAKTSSQTVTFSGRNAPLKMVFSEIEKQTGYVVFCNKEDLKNTTPVTISVRNMPLTDFLRLVLEKQPLSYSMTNETIILSEAPKLVFPFPRTVARIKPVVVSITGRIIDKEGAPVPGATISVKGGTIGAIADENGNFSLAGVPENTTLEISAMGFTSLMLRVSGNTASVVPSESTVGGSLVNSSLGALQIRLERNLHDLDAVVVTALNVKRDSRSIGYLVEKVKGSEVSENKVVNIQSALSGKIPGVDVSNTSNGVAGSKRITIRGISSISGNNQPLWVVDGIPINTSTIGNATPSGGGGIDFGNGLTYINPDDIEEITVLKGNAAAALYGSRASAGVILVTTKSGSQLGKNRFEVSYNMGYTVDKIRDFTDWQYEYGQGVDGQAPETQQDALSAVSSWGKKLDGSDVMQFDGQVRPYTAQKDNQKNFYKNGHTFSNTISLQGRTEHTNFRLSTSYLTNNDIVPNTEFKRNGFSFNSQTKYNKLSVNAVMNYTIETAKNRQRIGGNYSNVHYTLLHLPVNINVLDMQPGFMPNGDEIGLNDQGIPTNPYFVTNRIYEEDTRRRVNGALEIKYDLTKWLYAKGRVLEDYYDYAEADYTPIGVIWSPKGGGMNQTESRNSEENFELIIGTNKHQIAKDFSVSGFVGGNIFNSLTQSSNINGTVFVLKDIYTINNLSVKYPSTGYSRQRINSLFFNAEFAYKDLFVNFTGRKDWFSTLPLSNNSLFYPSVSLSYILNSRMYPSWVSFTRLRGSFAQVSGGAAPYSLNLSYNLDRDNYNGINLQAIGNTTVPNAELRPLLSTEYEAGIDAGLFANKLTLNLTYYNRRTRQDIVSTNISIASGYNNAVLNLGNISNKGIEASLSFNAIKRNDFNWEITGIFSYNRNKVESLGPSITKLQLAQSKTGNAFINVEKGLPYGQIVGYRYVSNEKREMVYDANGYPLNDGVVHILGTGNYDKIASLRNSFTWKNLTLQLLVDAKFGADIYSEINSLAVGNGKHKMTLEGRETGLDVHGVDINGSAVNIQVAPENIGSYYGRVASFTDNFVYDASFVKLREISLGYSIPQSIVNKLHLSRASVSAVARNLFILYKNTPNMDPESNTTSGNAQGIAATVYPSVRNIGVNLNVTF